MSKPIIPLNIGDIFGRLTVLGVDPYSKFTSECKAVYPSRWKYICRCSCGKTKSFRKGNLVSGHTKSCGCLRDEVKNHINEKKNPVKVEGEITKVIFNNTKGMFTIIDTEDYTKIKQFCWFLKESYAKANSKGSVKAHNILIHRIIMSCPSGLVVDHINGDTLDNRKSNLRVCTIAQNTRNKSRESSSMSGLLGVYFIKRKGWCAKLTVLGKSYFKGYYKTKSEALTERKKLEIKYFEEYSTVLSRC